MTFPPKFATVFSVLFLLIVSGVSSPRVYSEIKEHERQFFEEKIRPVLVTHCYECHSAKSETLDADYSVDTRMGIREAGSSGEKAIIPGDPEKSVLYTAIQYQGLEMPPEKKLSAEVIADFKKWIEMGAPDPRSGDSNKIRQQLVEKKSEGLWSLQKPVKPALPEVKNKKWSKHPVDQFLLAEMEKQKLKPVADAPAEALLRRVYFDLIGLPPSPEEVEKFTNSPTPEAYEKTVDSLLASKHFGERWGRHWLDLARYAESSGMEFNFTYPHAWPYRDYVIESFNKDKPYDRFLTEQIAGDLLEAKNISEKEENQIATGFLAVGPKRHDAGTTEFSYDLMDDQIKAVSKTFLGLTAGCSRCHDHKFDPIPTKDYYSLASIFKSTKALYGTKTIKYSRHPSGLIPFGENAQELHKNYLAHLENVNKINKELQKAESKLSKLENQEKEKQDPKAIAETKEEIKKIKGRIKEAEKNAPKQPKYAMGVEQGKPVDLHVAVGGNPSSKGDKAPRGFLSAVKIEKTFAIEKDSCGRLELAQWMTAPDHPLVSRVMVNRIWQHLFGTGIVPTPNNFGVIGKKPSHPELLDYLAVTYLEKKWSTKQMIKMLVMTRAYQLATASDSANELIDPQNVFVWKASSRRLEAEPLRDAILAVSGELDLTPGEGSSVTPIGQRLSRDVAYEKLNPKNKKRSVYSAIVRNYEPHFFQEFDFASSSLVVGTRSSTTTAKQALFFLNNDFIIDQSAAAAKFLHSKYPKDSKKCVEQLYLRALSRKPSSEEAKLAVSFLGTVEKHLAEKNPEVKNPRELALTSLVQTLLSSAEFRYLVHPGSSEPSSPRSVLDRKTVQVP